ncbi:plastocyanin/azurin family copper-binding protein [Natrinema pellirubrum]|nr:plastocyanin/azurin family copper-binding protein [Natrinema pellirubrum]
MRCPARTTRPKPRFEASSNTVEFVCEPHYYIGMRGTIEVRSGE